MDKRESLFMSVTQTFPPSSFCLLFEDVGEAPIELGTINFNSIKQ